MDYELLITVNLQSGLFGRHIVVAGKTEVFDTWECDWLCEFGELAEEPTTDGQKLVLKVPVGCCLLFKLCIKPPLQVQ